MIWNFLSVERVHQLHEEQMELFGGSAGLRDEGLLISAVNRARNKAEYDEAATIVTVAASVGYGLIKNHAYVDGNKRVGLAAVVAMLDMNGYILTADTDEQVDIVQKVAASEVTQQQWTEWLERNISLVTE
jgi:death on curing protein